jgi:2-haloacid dehalogenase
MWASRREFLGFLAAGAVLHTSPAGALAQGKASAKIRAVAFDGFPVFDPRPVLGLAKSLYGKDGGAFVAAFRARLFEYQWLRALGQRYRDFLSIADDAHMAAAAQLGVDATPATRAALRDAFLSLKAWPDAADTLRLLKAKGIGLAFLSNMTPQMLDAGIANSGLGGLFDHVLSTDAAQTFKPDPRAYQLGADAFGLPKEQIAFAAFAGWDAAGASWFGYPAVWINRLGAAPDALGAQLVAHGRDLKTLTQFMATRA